jgi:SAM-dependent methyltransferase
MEFENEGYCHCCRSNTLFRAYGSWLRDTYLCTRCHSIPRQRALQLVLDTVFPSWEERELHESSPSNDFLSRHASRYSSSHYFPDIPGGQMVEGCRCENLEAMTFADATFDLLVTQDVFEHLFDPRKAATEITRVLRPGGAHVFTAPKHRGLKRSYQRARLNGSEVEHLHEPCYHANPVGDGKALVTWDYGDDFEYLLAQWSGCPVVTYVTRDRQLGLGGEYLEVFVVRKAD